ncbi:ADP-ribose 1''-phosphate phosphatase [Knufia obscura]|uniref:ADP-ribose 1''-phosphate phosphatase n=2 Tax=Knufia TaxID=430999 RepID=A0AAN8EBK1_9EURO|nr:ADP-ribose 1''-phosphate phosphatase [Knufia obscura]KAK5951524.1 ADP-ribose 1''-phosphate phosphatase [Knufia fluminis]
MSYQGFPSGTERNEFDDLLEEQEEERPSHNAIDAPRDRGPNIFTEPLQEDPHDYLADLKFLANQPNYQQPQQVQTAQPLSAVPVRTSPSLPQQVLQPVLSNTINTRSLQSSSHPSQHKPHSIVIPSELLDPHSSPAAYAPQIYSDPQPEHSPFDSMFLTVPANPHDKFGDPAMDVENQSPRPTKRRAPKDPMTAGKTPAEKRAKKSKTDIKSDEPPLRHAIGDITSTTPAIASPFQILDTDQTIRNLPDDSIIVHATNCLSTWGAGFALELRKEYRQAEQVYKRHCDSFIPPGGKIALRDDLIGTCLLIPPQFGFAKERRVWVACLFASYGYGRMRDPNPGVDRPDQVQAATRSALEHLHLQLRQVSERNYKVIMQPRAYGTLDLRTLHLTEPQSNIAVPSSIGGQGSETGAVSATFNQDNVKSNFVTEMPPPPKDIYSPKICQGRFNVPWEITSSMIKEVFADWQSKWYILPEPK